MNTIYKFKELVEPSVFQRIFKKFPVENAIIEINNLLAEHPLKEIKIEEIEAISEKYKVDLHSEFDEKLKELYSIYLKECLSDNSISEQELNELNYLKTLLHLQDYEVELLHNKLAGEIYEHNYNDVIIDGKIYDSEKEFLQRLKENLRLSTIVEEKITNESRQTFLQKQFNKIVADGRISPDEWEELTITAKNLDDTINLDEKTKEKVEKFKLYWLIEHGELPIKEVSIYLQQNEQCYFVSGADWLEHRTVTKRYNYSGPTARIRIMKGVYYRFGSVGIQRSTSEELQLIDSGRIFVTNKRIIFLGNKKSTNIPLNKILSINPYSDGVGIEKSSGRSPIITVSTDADLLVMILSRVINDL
jgi:hypothetical protein